MKQKEMMVVLIDLIDGLKSDYYSLVNYLLPAIRSLVVSIVQFDLNLNMQNTKKT